MIRACGHRLARERRERSGPTTQVDHDLGSARTHPACQVRERTPPVVAELLVLLGVPRVSHGRRLSNLATINHLDIKILDGG